MRVFVLLLVLCVTALSQEVAIKTSEYMAAEAQANHFSGVVLIAKDGKPLFEHTYGFADIEHHVPNRLATKFRIASITKVFTAAAVLMLRDEGKLKLDDSICNYINHCPDSWRPITIKHLLTHSSGIPDDFGEITSMRREHKSPAEFIDAITHHEPTFPSGTRFRYSNSGFILLGGVIARVSGESYADFLRKRIFEPLKLKDTIAEISPAPGEAIGYSWDGEQYRKVNALDISGLSSATMVVSTAPDLLQFVEALQQGKLLKPDTVTEMWTLQLVQSGYAWHISTVNGRKVVFHGGDIEGFISELNYYPAQRVLIVSLSNVGGTSPARLVSDLAAISFGEPYSIPHERKFIQFSQAQMKSFAGTYRLNTGGTICVTIEADKLMMAPGGGGASECRAESADRCFLQRISDDLTFVRDASGKVTGFREGSHAQFYAEKKSETEYQQCPSLFSH